MQKENLDAFYHKQAWLYDFSRKFFLFAKRVAVDKASYKPGDVVIDLACGTGFNTRFLNSLGVRVIGVDYSEALLAVARNKYPQATFIKHDVSDVEFDTKANVVLCSYSLSMIDQWQQTIANMKQLIQDDGVVVILDFHYPW